MIDFYIWTASIILIGLIRPTTQCDSKTLQGCLLGETTETTKISLLDYSAYGYGFWFQYLAMSFILSDDLAKFPNLEGFLLIREINPDTSKYRVFLYQDWKNNNANQEKYLFLQYESNSQMIQLAKFIFDSFDFQGKWIHIFVSYQFPYQRQIIMYDILNDNCQIINYQSSTNLELKETIITQGGEFKLQLNQNDESKQFAQYPGRISKAEYNFDKNNVVFNTVKEFKNFIEQKFIPQPFCQTSTYDTSLISNYKYKFGLIQLESWVRIDYVFNVNFSASLFGVEVLSDIDLEGYQKLVDLQYCLIQAWKSDLANGVYFQSLNQIDPEFHYYEDQFLGVSDVVFHTLKQDLKQWHYVSILYGFDNSYVPVSNLKMWFLDGEVYDVQYHNKSFLFQESRIKMRSAFLINLAVNGIQILAESSKITVCLPESFDLMKSKFFLINKECHFSCLDCNGPYLNQCINCDQSSNRYLENSYCKCTLGYIENNLGNCIQFLDFYPTSIQDYNAKNQTLSQFGYFPIKEVDNQIIYIRCPQFNEIQLEKISCIECLTQPESFAKLLKCESDYVFNSYGQYELIQREDKDIEIYFLDTSTSSLTLCIGCKSFCNQNIDSNCHFNSLLQVYIQCQSQFYYENGECVVCNSNCKTCEDFSICTSCYDKMTLNPNNNECLECPKDCLECEYNSVFQGQCYPCSKYCLECIYVQNPKDGQYYNRCNNCIDNSKYYLSINAVDCIQNLDLNCIYAIQFHKSWFMRDRVNTIFYMYESGDFNSNQLINYCALCAEGYASLLSGQCVRIDSIPDNIQNKQYCIQMYQMEVYQSLQLNQLQYLCMVYTKEFKQIVSVSNGCENLLFQCAYCFNNICLQCYPGYYSELVSGQCVACPSEPNCYRCEQRSKQWKNGWKIWYAMVHYLLKRRSFQGDVFGNEPYDKLEVVCKTCTVDFEFYQDKCIKKCADNCELCIKSNGQNKCVKCKMYEGRRLSLYDGECIDCPRYCQICKPKTNSQLLSANPYFSNSDIKSSTHTCLMLQTGLSFQDYYYDTKFQQFFKLSETGTDPNSITLKFNLYCSSELFNQHLDLAQDKQHFLQQNVKIDELITNNQSQSNFGRIENLNLYTYLSIQQIQEVELQFSFIQDCSIKLHSYIFTTLIQNIYFVTSAKIKLIGNGYTLFLNSNLEVLNFESISIQNLIIQLQSTVNIHLQSLSALKVQFNSVVIQQYQEDLNPIAFNIVSTNLQELWIQDLSLQNLNLQSVASFFYFEYTVQQQYIDINIDQFTIKNSMIHNSNIILLDNYFQKTTNCQFNNILIVNSDLNLSQFMKIQNNQQLVMQGSISQISIVSSFLQDIQPLFQTFCFKSLNISGISLTNSTFQNFILFQTTNEQINKDYLIKFCNLKNSSIINFVQDYQFQSIIFQNIEVNQVYHDDKTILINLVSNDFTSTIKMSNIILDTITILDNIQLVQNLQSIMSIIIIQSNFIEISDIKIIRSTGITEFLLTSAMNLVLSNFTITLNPKYFYKSIITDEQCLQLNTYSKYTTTLIVQKAQNIRIQNFYISNLILLDFPMIYIISIATQIIKRSESVVIDSMNLDNCIIQKSQTINQISGILIQSEQQQDIQILNSKFNNNIYYSYYKESESDSALIFYIIAQNSKILLINCQFKQNYVSQSENSLLYINAEQINVIDSSFFSTNYIFDSFLKHINWKYQPYTLTLEQIKNQFQVQSASGNGQLISSSVQFRNINIEGSFSTSAGCFKITLENEGQLLVKNSVFKNIYTKISEEQSFGGCLYVIDRSINIQIDILDSIYDTIIGTAEGGVIYLKPIALQVNFNFTNVTFQDVFSNDGNIAKLNFLSYNQLLYMQNCRILQTIEGYSKFRSLFSSFQKYETTMISIQQGYLILRDIFVQLYLNIFLQLNYQSRISLTSIEIDYSYYYQNSIMQISFSADQQCKIEITGLKIKNFKWYKDDPKLVAIQIRQVIDEQQKLSQDCRNEQILGLKNQTYELINLSDFIAEPQNQIQNLVQITNVKNKDSISIKSSQFSNNQCLLCLSGLIFVKLIEFQSDNIIISNIWLMDNQCGENGCLCIVQEFLSQDQKKMSTLTLDTMFCYRNQAKKGGCIVSQQVGLKIKNSIFSENLAVEQGGSIYYDGEVTNLLLQNNLIVSNTAQEGGAIYLGNQSLPELNKTLNYFNNNTAYGYGNISSSHSTQLTVMYKNLQFSTLNSLNNGRINAYLTNQSNSSQILVLKLPSGQQIQTYQYFNIQKQKYEHQHLKFRILALNAYHEQQFHLNNSECLIESGHQQGSQETVFTNNYTNYNRKVFDQETQDYNLDDLIIYYGTENDQSKLILQISCNSVQIPKYEDTFPHQIMDYNSKYQLILYIQTYPCQIGEYKNLTDNACYLCDINKKQYSVTINATTCQFMDEDTIASITPAQLQLKSGYWRPYINSEIIEYCQNKIENCLGGWKQGDETCEIGQLGACCEACDQYNIRGNGQYSLKKLYQCQKCDDLDKQIIYIILITLWNLLSIYLSTNGVEKLILELQKNKVGTRQLIINNNKQTGPIMKMFTNYLQILAIIINFNVEIPQAFKDYYNITGNSQTMLLVTTDCFLAQNFQEGLIYVKIIYSIICPLFYGWIYLSIYFLLKSLKKIVYNEVIPKTCVLYLFCYFQIQVIQLLISSLSFRTLSDIKWIQGDLAYQFDTSLHQQWIPYLIVLAIIIGATVPGIFMIYLAKYRNSLQKYDVRRLLGYLYLEYQHNAYYWEIIRIVSRELIMIAITFYQDNMIIKCTLLFIVLLAYYFINLMVLPFQTKSLNQLEQMSTLLCTFTLFEVLSLSLTSSFSTIAILFIIITNIYLSITFIQSLIHGYLQSMEELIDKIKDIIRENLKSKFKDNRLLDSWLVNKGQRRKLIIERFKKIKKHLSVVRSKLSSIERQKFSQNPLSSGLPDPRDFTLTLVRQQQILFTSSDYNTINDPLTNLINKKKSEE
ncbi:unnamed protein product (macronuclear) [Paramecium tetraurelia]|uniref:Uncharacterized protein n=1 Tax=Paramecium tetraurelia TaxID=5888 RepID=A0BU22_PARTE|nr:uncharacterized protein GSPATT00032271001 [Paramecium tetraurelia]CAK62039.1 unnamed protein product [Paramecium tetraurelia]|eukprot:XP_001429437.1 hypothetical protein (macronuclear) [Paramecium tetraurelia strain d4-2]